MAESITDRFKAEIQRRLGAEEVFLYFKGRVALYALLKAMGVGPGGEVVMPAYTCVVVANAVMYLGARPVYTDIQGETCNADPGLVRAAITSRTKAVMLQSTYGYYGGLEQVAAAARERGVPTIEDCAHSFGGTHGGRTNGTLGDAAFFSTQWSKPFSTGVGGFAAAKSPSILESLRAVNAGLEDPGVMDTLNLRLLYFVRRRLLTGRLYWPMVRAYRWLSRKNIVLGSSSGGELEPPHHVPPGYFKRMGEAQAEEGLRNLAGLETAMALRKRNALIYSEALAAMGKNHLSPEKIEDHACLRYPLLSCGRDALMEKAVDEGVRLGDWFVSPLHPLVSGLQAWGCDPEKYPVANYVCRHMVNLPTDEEDPEPVLDFIKRNSGMIV